MTKVLSHTTLERVIGLLFEYPETGEFGCWPVLVVKAGEVETFMVRESLISDNLQSVSRTRSNEYYSHGPWQSGTGAALLFPASWPPSAIALHQASALRNGVSENGGCKTKSYVLRCGGVSSSVKGARTSSMADSRM